VAPKVLISIRRGVRGHLQEAENYLLLNKSMTTVLDLLG
jgi:hypothetical protein